LGFDLKKNDEIGGSASHYGGVTFYNGYSSIVDLADLKTTKENHILGQGERLEKSVEGCVALE